MIEPHEIVFRHCYQESAPPASSGSSPSPPPRQLPRPSRPPTDILSTILSDFFLIPPPKVDYNTCTIEELNDQADYIRRLESDPDRAESLLALDAQYKEAVIEAITEADALHKNYTLFFKDVEIDPETGDTRCTAKQLKGALKMVRDHFYGLMTLARTTEQHKSITLLIQTMLCGLESIEKAPAPGSLFSFCLRETEGLESKPVPYEIPGGHSFLFHQLIHFISNGSLREKFLSAVNQYSSDMVSRDNLAYQLDGTLIKSASKMDDPDGMSAALLKAYAEHLMSHPGAAESQLAMLRDSDFYRALQRAFPCDDIEDIAHPHPSSTLEAMLEQAAPHLTASMERLVSFKDRLRIAQEGRCSLKDVNMLLRGKLIEYFLLLNQASCAEPLIQLKEVLITYAPYHLHGFNGEGNLFHFSGEGAHRLECRVPVRIGVTDGDFAHLDYQEMMSDHVIFATAIARQTVPSLYETNKHAVTVTPLSEVRFGWKAPLPFIDWLVSQVNPDYREDSQKQVAVFPDVNSPRTRRKATQEASKILHL